MYIWRSEALKNYGSGWLIVDATDVDTARQILLEQASKWFMDHKVWDEEFMDDEEQEAMAEFIKLVMADLRAEAVIDDVLLIPGSD